MRSQCVPGSLSRPRRKEPGDEARRLTAMVKLVTVVQRLLLLAVLGESTNAQFLEQPDAGTMFVPVNGRVTLSCSVAEGYSVDWEVRINDGLPLRAANVIHEPILLSHDFTIIGVITNASTLSFGILDESGNQTNNATTVTCIAQSGLQNVDGNGVQVIFYDPPPPPTKLRVDENGLNSLNISWFLGFIERVPVNYTLTILNLNTTSSDSITEILTQYYVFSTNRPCDAYSFTVSAVTAAGNSSPSQEINFTRNGNTNTCSVTTPEPTGATTTANTGITGSALAGAIIGTITAVVVISIIVVVAIILTWQINKCIATKKMFRNITAVTTLDCKTPVGLTSFGTKVFLLEEGKRGITVYENLEWSNFLPLEEQYLAEVTVHKTTGDIYVTTGESHKVLKLNGMGEKICESPEEQNFKFPNGLSFNRDELYVCDSGNHIVRVLDLKLDLLRTIPGKNTNCKPFQSPMDVDFDEQNNVYIAESRKIHVLTPDGSYKKTICERKIKDAICIKIVGDSIFVTDSGKACISIYSLDGKHIQDFGKDENLFERPRGITVDKNGYVYVSTHKEHKLLVFKCSERSN